MSLKVQNITKSFGRQKVLNDISFQMESGEIVGLLGPNGAGKSTLMKILCGIYSVKTGRVFLNRLDISKNSKEAKKIIGYLPENNPLDEDLYVKEYLSQVISFYGTKKNAKKRIANTIKLTGLGIEQHKKIKMLSKGYRQRVGLAQALIHDPKILILDEPTSGLDPNQLVEVRNLIKQTQKGKTILFSSHNLNEVKAVCKRILIIDRGEIVADIKNDFENTELLEKTFRKLTQ